MVVGPATGVQRAWMQASTRRAKGPVRLQARPASPKRPPLVSAAPGDTARCCLVGIVLALPTAFRQTDTSHACRSLRLGGIVLWKRTGTKICFFSMSTTSLHLCTPFPAGATPTTSCNKVGSWVEMSWNYHFMINRRLVSG